MLITQKYEVKLKEKMHKVHMSIKICQNPHNFQVLYKNLEIINSHSLCEALFVKLCDYLEVSFSPKKSCLFFNTIEYIALLYS